MEEGLILHLAAEDLAIGEPVSNWVSRVEPPLAASQDEPDRQPTVVTVEGRRMVRFDGEDDRLQLSNNLFGISATARNIFVVLQSDKYRGHVIGAVQEEADKLFHTSYALGIGANKPFVNANDSRFGGRLLVSAENLLQVGPQIIAGSISNAGSRLRTRCHINQHTNRPVRPDLSLTTIGATTDPNEAFGGDIAEILVYDRVLRPEEEDQMFAYLAGRHGTEYFPTDDADSDGILDACDRGAVYLKAPDITVDLLQPGELTGGDEKNAITANSPTSVVVHTPARHIEANVAPGEVAVMELLLDLQSNYEIVTVHLWNYFDGDFGVNSMTFYFYGSDENLIHEIDDLDPMFGYEDSLAQDFPVSLPGETGIPGVRYVRALFRGGPRGTEIMNLGFTAILEGTQ